ncbi:MAG: methyltransferase [Flavobacteriaceae bacterium]|jgi:hypothetical protein
MPFFTESKMYAKHFPHKRYRITQEFVAKHLDSSETILDLGVDNPLSQRLRDMGYSVTNTQGEDLDFNRKGLNEHSTQAVTAFEILEHLLNPFSVLNEIQAPKLFLSVPLRLWFAPAYRHKTDPRDRHFHEFEAWQMRWLLEKTGWSIIDEVQFTNPTRKLGIRPLLRLFTPRYLLIYAQKL